MIKSLKYFAYILLRELSLFDMLAIYLINYNFYINKLWMYSKNMDTNMKIKHYPKRTIKYTKCHKSNSYLFYYSLKKHLWVKIDVKLI
jgi:hypothetical protein